MSDDPRVKELLDELFDRQATPEEVCGAYPELLSVVRDRYRQIKRARAELDALLPEGPYAELPTFPPEGLSLPIVPGYRIEAVLGHGGMGVVFRARHLRLNRLVALKMALAGAYAGPNELERFRREVEAVAALRHPNVVQVYDVGEADGRPYFSMEFMEGGSLAQQLTGTPQSARQAVRLLTTLAEAVQAAHRSGFVHRDLKPGNVLLTADSIPKVSDFGLARRLDEDANLTRSGAQLGTPSYMAPEQAEGKSHEVGPAADIYALGAILYEMLTGRPPFRAESASETIRQVIYQDPAPPSRLNAKVPRELETICLKCLNKEPERRYDSAAALADDLGRFADGRPILARPPSWGGRVWRWGRRNPASAGLVAAILALSLLTVGGTLWFEAQRAERQGRAREAIEAALGQLPNLRRQGRWSEAEAILAQAGSRLDEAGSGDLPQRISQAESDVRLATALEQIRLTPAVDESRFNYDAMNDAYTRVFNEAGLDVSVEGEEIVERIRESEVRPQLVMALDHLAFIADARGKRQSMERLLELARKCDPDPQWGDRFRNPALWGDQNALRRLADEARQELDRDSAETGPPTPLVTLLAAKLGQQEEQAEPLLRAAQERHPADFWLNYALGETLRERKPAEAVGFYRAALAMRPTLAAVHQEVGMALRRLHQFDEAIRALRKATELEPAVARYHFHLGLCLRSTGQLDGALAEFRRATELDPQGGMAHVHLGSCLHAKHDLEQAIGEYRRAIEIDPKGIPAYYQLAACLRDVGRSDEAITVFQSALQFEPRGSLLYFGSGMCYQDRGRFDEAMREYRQSIKLDPMGAPAHYQLGTCLLHERRLDEALAEFRRAVELDPSGVAAHCELGLCLKERKQIDEALAEFRRALQLDPRSSLAQYGIGTCLQNMGRLDEAMTAYRSSIEVDPNGSAAHYQLGVCLENRGRHNDAIAELRRSIELDPNGSGGHCQLGICLKDQSQLDEALAEFRRSIELDPQGSPAHYGVATVLQARGQLDEAMAVYRHSIELDPEGAPGHYQLGVCLQDRGRFDEAIAEFRRSIELNPKGVSAHLQLAKCLQRAGRIDEALAEYRRNTKLEGGLGDEQEDLAEALLRNGRYSEGLVEFQHALDLIPSKDTTHRQTLQQWLKVAERLIALESRLPAILQGKEQPGAVELLELAWYCRTYGRPRAAVELYALAFAARPRSASDLTYRYRSQAARTAALAAAKAKNGDLECADSRAKAFAWLRADLDFRTTQIKEGKAGARALVNWQTDPELASVRDAAELARMPATERAQWQKLWADVTAVIAADPLEEGRARAGRRDWKGARDCYARAMNDRLADDGHFSFEYAALLLLSEDRAGYVDLCGRVVERSAKSSSLRPYLVARVCTLAADSYSDPSRVVRLAEKELQGSAHAFWSLTEQGALAYRTGRFRDAMGPCEESLRVDPKLGRAVLNWLWLAMAHERLGETKEARRWSEKAREWFDKYGDAMPNLPEDELGLHFHNWLEAQILRREAEALLSRQPPQRQRTSLIEAGELQRPVFRRGLRGAG
jgi:serine/threonine-protein kinase